MIREVILAAAGATGFALLFGMQRKKVWIITVNSAAAWYLYLLIGRYTGNMIFAMFMVTVLVGLVSGILAIFVKCPLMVFATPILIPFIPGAALYYVMYDIVNGLPALAEDFTSLLLQAGAIALGILVAEIGLTVVKMIYVCGKKQVFNGFL